MIHQLLTHVDPRRSLRAQIGLASGVLTILLALTAELWQPYGVWASLGLGLLFAGVGWLAAGRITQPLALMTQRANDLSRAAGSPPLPIYAGQDEVAQLSQSLAQMVAGLTEAKVELEGRMLAHTDQLAVLYDVLAVASDMEMATASSVGSLNMVLSHSLQRVLTAVSAQAGTIHLLNKNGEQFDLLATHSIPRPNSSFLDHLPTDDSLLHGILTAAKPTLITNLPADTRSCHLASAMGHGMFLGIPMQQGGQAIGVLGIIGDDLSTISDEEIGLLKSLADQLVLVVENHRLRQQAQRLAIMEERNRLARELHDSVTQSLYSLTLFAGAAQRLMQTGRIQEVGGYITEMSDAAQQALKEMRLLVHKLRPPLLQQLGLARALQNRLSAVEVRAGIKTHLTVERELHLLPELEEVVYHVAQESLNNALKHARATEVWVEIFLQPDGGVRLEVRDDGRGFDWETAVAGGGLGLTSMQERVEAVGGSINYHSGADQGTTVTVCLPPKDNR